MSDIVNEDIRDIVSLLKHDLKKIEGKNVLITGASGMLASYLVKTLITANEKIFNKKCNLYLVIRKKNPLFGKQRFLHYIYADVAEKLPNLPEIDYFIHAASPAAPKIYTQDMVNTLNANILGLYSLLEKTGSGTKSFLYFSSSEIYGTPVNSKKITENYLGSVDHLNPRSCYLEAKKVCETVCLNYFWERKLPVKIVRVFHTFGPGLNLEDGRIFSDFIKDGLQGNNIEIKGNKNLQRSFLYIKDATIMFLKILLSNANGEVFNVGNDKNTESVLTVARIVATAFNSLNRSKIKVVEKKNRQKNLYKFAPKSSRPDISKFKQFFNYSPQTSSKEAFVRTIKYFLEKSQ